MSDHIFLIQLVFATGTVVPAVLGAFLWRSREKRGAIALTVVNGSVSLWSLCLFLTTVAGETLTILALRAVYIPVGINMVALLVFALEYTGRERYVTPKSLAVLLIHPVLLVFFAFLNPADLFFAGFDMSAVGGNEQLWGPAFVAHTLYSYTIALGAVVLLVQFLITSTRSLYRGQAVALALAILSPLLLNALFLAGGAEFDTTPIGIVATAAFLTFALLRYDLVNISPIGREKLVSSVRDGMLVVDTDDQIVESNPAARAMLTAGRDSVAGETVDALLADSPALMGACTDLMTEDSPHSRTVSHGDRYLELDVSSIDDDRGRHVGWLVLLQDVTERIQRERDLEGQIEKLDQFASLVSHDLRNPINVASGYIEQTQTTGDLDHLDKASDAVERMEEIIDDALTLAREGQDVTDPTAVAVGEIARAAWANVETDGATLDVDADGTIIADGDRLKRLFENLFRNAVEHGSTSPRSQTPEDAIEHGMPAQTGTSGDGQRMVPAPLTVSVGLVGDDMGETTLSVADDGAGIPEDERKRVFENGYTTNRDGTGLGLAIVEQIAHAHGWGVTVTESDSGGARFELSGVNRPLS